MILKDTMLCRKILPICLLGAWSARLLAFSPPLSDSKGHYCVNLAVVLVRNGQRRALLLLTGSVAALRSDSVYRS
jgi:hypothetical protein